MGLEGDFGGFGAHFGVLNIIWGHLGSFWGQFWDVGVRLRVLARAFRGSLGRSGGLFVPFGGLWGHFGVFGGSFWMIWGSFRVILGLFGLFGRGCDDTGGPQSPLEALLHHFGVISGDLEPILWGWGFWVSLSPISTQIWGVLGSHNPPNFLSQMQGASLASFPPF